AGFGPRLLESLLVSAAVMTELVRRAALVPRAVFAFECVGAIGRVRAQAAVRPERLHPAVADLRSSRAWMRRLRTGKGCGDENRCQPFHDATVPAAPWKQPAMYGGADVTW